MATESIAITRLFDTIGLTNDNNSLNLIEKKTAVLKPDVYKDTYSTFNSEFLTYLSKVSNSTLKKYVKDIFDRDLIYLSIDTNSKNMIYGSVGILNNKLGGIFLDVKDLEIDIESGESARIDDVIHMTYFQFIRGTVIINYSKIKNDDELNKLIISYLTLLFIRTLKLPTDEKTKALIIALVTNFYYKFMLNDNRAEDKMLMNVADAQKEYVESQINTRSHILSKYKKFRDIVSVFIDFNITNDSPNKMMMTLIQKLRINNLLYLTTSLDYLIATMIVSTYPIDILAPTNIVTVVQTKFETAFNKYMKSLSFDAKTAKDFFKRP